MAIPFPTTRGTVVVTQRYGRRSPGALGANPATCAIPATKNGFDALTNDQKDAVWGCVSSWPGALVSSIEQAKITNSGKGAGMVNIAVHGAIMQWEQKYLTTYNRVASWFGKPTLPRPTYSQASGRITNWGGAASASAGTSTTTAASSTSGSSGSGVLESVPVYPNYANAASGIRTMAARMRSCSPDVAYNASIPSTWAPLGTPQPHNGKIPAEVSAAYTQYSDALADLAVARVEAQAACGASSSSTGTGTATGPGSQPAGTGSQPAGGGIVPGAGAAPGAPVYDFGDGSAATTYDYTPGGNIQFAPELAGGSSIIPSGGTLMVGADAAAPDPAEGEGGSKRGLVIALAVLGVGGAVVLARRKKGGKSKRSSGSRRRG